MGLVYLLHFDQPYHHARHYLGFCEDGNIAKRMRWHRSGNGSKLIRAITRAGISFRLVKIWLDKDRHFERSLKNKKRTPALCPVCKLHRKENKNVKNKSGMVQI